MSHSRSSSNGSLRHTFSFLILLTNTSRMICPLWWKSTKVIESHDMLQENSAWLLKFHSTSAEPVPPLDRLNIRAAAFSLSTVDSQLQKTLDMLNLIGPKLQRLSYFPIKDCNHRYSRCRWMHAGAILLAGCNGIRGCCLAAAWGAELATAYSKHNGAGAPGGGVCESVSSYVERE
ncbi:hypothetical protein BKA62DRAFT_676751 [Auriculariales sp. MPI-PUGE-AT-0066]|nr:hypothetical protein BKA62DRAFT_676751 [Auriculariales sp. MPI-PUGE-AT-0066]